MGEPLELDPADADLVRAEAVRRGQDPRHIAHEAVVAFLKPGRRLGFVGIATGARPGHTARDSDDLLNREHFGEPHRAD